MLPAVAEVTGTLARFCEEGTVLTGLEPSVGMLCRCFGPALAVDATEDRVTTGGLEVFFLVATGAGDDGFRADTIGGLAALGAGALSLGLGPAVCFLFVAGAVLDCRCGGVLVVGPSDGLLGALFDRGTSV